MKKSLIILIVSLIGTSSAFAQQLPRFTFDYMNPYRIHGAAAGYDKGTDLVVNYREQWVGMTGTQGRNPQTFGLSLSSRIKPARLGVGLNLMTDRAGGFRYTGGQLSLAYHLKLDPEDNFQLGFGLSGRFYMVDYDESQLTVQTGGDMALMGGDNSFLADASAGMFIHGHGFRAGFTVDNLFNADIGFSEATGGTQVSKAARHYNFTASYKHNFSDGFGIEPMFGMRTLFSEKIQFDLGGRVMFAKETLFLGGLFRFGGDSEGMSGLGGINIKEKFQVGYSYDYALTSLQDVSNGSHEAFIKIGLGKADNSMKEPREKKDKAPKEAKEKAEKAPKAAKEKAEKAPKEAKEKADKAAGDVKTAADKEAEKAAKAAQKEKDKAAKAAEKAKAAEEAAKAKAAKEAEKAAAAKEKAEKAAKDTKEKAEKTAKEKTEKVKKEKPVKLDDEQK